ncbi:MAG: hypothetical protein QG564_138 [Campylobacterota bacterium]|nr:hypothetical protein [Campylobacterota bacterium]
MLEQILLSHSLLVKIFLGFLVGGLLIPFVGAKDPGGFRKASFIYTMIFQALIAMIAFVGIVALAMGEFSMTLSIILMIVVWIVMMYIEIRKYKLIKIGNLQNEQTYKLLKGAFLKISALQILLVVFMIVFKVMEVKGVISLS